MEAETAAVRTRMSVRRARRALFGSLSLGAISLALCAPSALATRGPSASWTLPHAVNEGAPIQFSWTGRHLGRNHRLVIQKPEGTAHTWRTIMRLSGNSGSAGLPGLGLGKYRFRIADLSGRRVLAQQVAGIAVFGEVPFSTLFNEQREPVLATPSASFPYVAHWPGEERPAFSVEHSSCLSVHIAFVGSSNHTMPGTTTITVVEESRDPVSASAPFEAIGSLDTELVLGQSWAMNILPRFAPSGETGGVTYINGYAICDSTKSFFS